MKKILSIFILFIAIMGATVVQAEGITVSVNSESVTFDTEPYIKNGRTLVPIRAVTEKMGLKVNWDNDSSTAIISSQTTTVKLSPGSNMMSINGTEQALDVAPELTNDRTCLPLRAVAEAFAATVGWDEDTQHITIDAPKENKLLSYSGTFGENQLSFTYSDSYFDDPDTNKNSLLVLSSVATIAANSEKSITEFLELCDFENIRLYNYDKDSTQADNYLHKSDFALGKKEINGKTVVMAVIRGTVENEWYSNFDMTDGRTETTLHYGFSTAAAEIVNKIEEYAPTRHFLLLCGHSRGGAVANLAAATLYKKDRNLTAFTFAAPNTVKSTAADEEMPIYNYVSQKDIITKIPLSKSGWDYTKHGKIYTLEDEVSEDIKTVFKRLTDKEYKPIRLEDVEDAENLLYSLAPTVSSYYEEKENGAVSPYSFFKAGIAPMLIGNSYDGLLYLLDSTYGKLTKFFVSHAGGDAAYQYKSFIGIVGYDDCLGITYEHCPEGYLSKLIAKE